MTESAVVFIQISSASSNTKTDDGACVEATPGDRCIGIFHTRTHAETKCERH